MAEPIVKVTECVGEVVAIYEDGYVIDRISMLAILPAFNRHNNPLYNPPGRYRFTVEFTPEDP